MTDQELCTVLRTTGVGAYEAANRIEALAAREQAWKDRFRALVGETEPDSAGNSVITLKAENGRLARENRTLSVKNASSLANNLCPDHRDKQAGRPCLACENERLTRERDEYHVALIAEAVTSGKALDERGAEIIRADRAEAVIAGLEAWARTQPIPDGFNADQSHGWIACAESTLERLAELRGVK
jgi:hypothetical protein